MRWLLVVLVLMGCVVTSSACNKLREQEPAAAAPPVEDWTEYPQPGAQTYQPEVPRMDLREPRQGEAVMLGSSHALVQRASKLVGIPLDFALPIRRQSPRVVYAFPPGLSKEPSSENLSDYPREYILRHASGGKHVYPVGLYCSAGRWWDWWNVDDPGASNARDKGLTIFKETKQGAISLVDCVPLPGNTWKTICLLDFDRDGLLDLIVSASDGEKIQVFTIQPDGKLLLRKALDETAFDGQQVDAIPCAAGEFSLEDLDHDGCLEIVALEWRTWTETYAYLGVYRYDRLRKLWIENSADFPAFLAEQNEFYRLYDAAYARFSARIMESHKTIPELLGPQWILLYWRGKPYVLEDDRVNT